MRSTRKLRAGEVRTGDQVKLDGRPRVVVQARHGDMTTLTLGTSVELQCDPTTILHVIRESRDEDHERTAVVYSTATA